jgi:hypothetical protein
MVTAGQAERSPGLMERSAGRPKAGRGLPGSYIVRSMYWPLFGGFIAFVLLALVLGWIMDPARRHDADRH